LEEHQTKYSKKKPLSLFSFLFCIFYSTLAQDIFCCLFVLVESHLRVSDVAFLERRVQQPRQEDVQSGENVVHCSAPILFGVCVNPHRASTNFVFRDSVHNTTLDHQQQQKKKNSKKERKKKEMAHLYGGSKLELGKLETYSQISPRQTR
jgi:hypothetical protein